MRNNAGFIKLFNAIEMCVYSGTGDGSFLRSSNLT